MTITLATSRSLPPAHADAGDGWLARLRAGLGHALGNRAVRRHLLRPRGRPHVRRDDLAGRGHLGQGGHRRRQQRLRHRPQRLGRRHAGHRPAPRPALASPARRDPHPAGRRDHGRGLRRHGAGRLRCRSERWAASSAASATASTSSRSSRPSRTARPTSSRAASWACSNRPPPGATASGSCSRAPSPR